MSTKNKQQPDANERAAILAYRHLDIFYARLSIAERQELQRGFELEGAKSLVFRHWFASIMVELGADYRLMASRFDLPVDTFEPTAQQAARIWATLTPEQRVRFDHRVRLAEKMLSEGANRNEIIAALEQEAASWAVQQ